MPTQLSGRVGVILAVLFFALWAIFPNGNLKHPNLKPGIDMVGGTSLLYEIKVPPGGAQGNLAEQVMTSLKKRVDPDGVRNLIWRPQGATRLEIQMPLTEKSKETEVLRQQFADAQQKLEETNLRIGEVHYAVEELKGEQRASKLKEMEQGSESRAKIFGALTTTWDQIQAAKQSQNAGEQARLQIQYDGLIDQLNDTNLQVSDLQNALDLAKPAARDKALADIRQRFTDFPARLAAIDGFVREYANYSQVKNAISGAAELKRLLRGSGVIEFHILADDLPQPEYQRMFEQLQRRGPRPQAGDTVRWYELDRDTQVAEDVEKTTQELTRAADRREQNTIITRASEGYERVKELYQSLLANLNDATQRRSLQNQIEDALLLGHGTLADYAGKKWALCYVTPDKCLVQREGQPRWALERAGSRIENGESKVTFEFDAQGARLFGDLTTANVHKPMAIVLDDKIISAPNINTPIIGGSGEITSGQRGGFGQDELQYLVNTLNAGALPAQLAEEPISEQTVGPVLGADNLRHGLEASILGLVAVAIFMIVYYHISGIVASAALMMNMVMILGVMAMFNATWTLPAVAGIVLTIGMSVDANVLIFERLREEQQRGLSLKMAMRNAYDRAASAIIDSNAVTAITCVILYWLGSEEVKGFGLTLLIGLISSLFTALFVTKTIFAAMLKYFNLQKLGCLPVSWPALGRLLHPNVNWMGLVRYFVTGSAIMMVLGFIAVGWTLKKGELFDIEFSSGTSVQFELKQPMDIGEIRSILGKAPESELPSPSIVSVGTNNTMYEVVTPSNDAPRVTNAILTELAGKINMQQPSDYQGVNDTYEQAMDKEIFPIAQDTRTIAGIAPNALRSHLGGVAIVLKDLTPRLSADEIKKRIEGVLLQPQANSATAGQYRQVDVEETPDGSTAIIMTSDPNSPYDAGDPIKMDQWTQDLVKPTWDLVRQAVHNPPKLQKVSNFDAQVAGEMQQDALAALGLSLVVIMGYIWLRFGNLKYGTATVVAMLHDTLLVIGFIGLSHVLGKPPLDEFFGKVLLIEPFRVNLTLVAAVLTVMSYSMVDTIVVFDRIRENRGKFGHVDPKIINDSVNQTLSRTLLTVFTTILSVFVMYVFGGSGIHGFTFVMLIGILIGTYSSFAIAAPILLIGEKPMADAGRGKPVGPRLLQGA